MRNPNQHREYLKTQIKTASREQLVLMLYDGCLRFCEKARTCMVEGNNNDAHHALMRAQAIIMELFYGLDLDQGGLIGVNLGRLYGYCIQRLVEANMETTPEKIEEVQKIFRNIREGWSGAMETAKSEQDETTEENVEIRHAAPPPAVKPKAAPRPAPKRMTAAEAAAMPRLSVQG